MKQRQRNRDVYLWHLWFFQRFISVMLAQHKKTVALPLCLQKVCAITPGRANNSPDCLLFARSNPSRTRIKRKLRCIKDCAREWNKHRKTGDRFIHADEIRDFLKTDTTIFKYKFGNKWIVNYDQLLPHLKKINRRESKLWKAYMARIGIKKSVTPRKKWLTAGLPDWSRTNGVPLRRRTLYPTEVQADIWYFSTIWKLLQKILQYRNNT